MYPAIPHLVELQRVDHQISALRAELEAFPKRIREADAKLSGARAEVAAAKEAHGQIIAERKKFEFEVQQWKDRARKYRDQSGAVKTNEAFRALQQAIAAERKEIEAQGTEKKKQLEAAIAEREKFIAPVPEELRDLYGRIAKRHNGTAMAEARDGQCRGCGMRVLPHILQQLRTETSEEVYRCESCGLILYTLEPIPVANPASGSANASSAASTNH